MLSHQKAWFLFFVYSCILALPLMLFSPPSYAVDEETEIEKIDINTAQVWLLAYKLHGIGEKKAIAIVEYREKHGPFQSIYDLDKVYGIGLKTIEKNKDKMMVILPEEDTTIEQTKADSPQTDETVGNEKNGEKILIEESTEGPK